MNRYILGGVVVMVGLAVAFMATQKKEVVEPLRLPYQLDYSVRALGG